jgi:tape measure domain-containing protein
MAEDVASIGVKFETDDIARGKASLEALAQQGPKVEKAMAGVEGAAAKTGKSLKTLGEGAGKGLDDIGKTAPKAADGVGRVAKSADDAKKALAGIGSSAANLGQVSSAAAASARGMAGFSAALQSTQKTLFDLQAQVSAAAASVAQLGGAVATALPSMQAVVKAQSDAAKSALDMGAAFKGSADQMRAYSASSAGVADTSAKTARSLDATATAARAFTTAMAVAGVGFGANELIAMVDGYTKFTAQLKLATKGASDYGVAMVSVKRIATDAQQGLGEVGTLYARIANGTAELGLNQRKLADITETVSLALKVSGATASESSSAMLQLSQAFASGVLRGEEFNSVNEAAPRLMKALADGINVPVGALRKMAEEGKLTSAVLSEALPKALGQLREEAKEVQTIGGAFTVLKNNIMEMVGAQSNASGTTKAFASGINALANNLDLLAAAGGAVAVVLGARFAASITASGVAFAASAVQAARYQAALASMAGVSTTAAAGLVTVGAAARGASAAMSLLGGPVGAVLTAVGLAATAFYTFGDSASALAKSIGGLDQPLEDLKRKIDALPPEKRISIIMEIKEDAVKQAKTAEASFVELGNSVMGAFTGMGAVTGATMKEVQGLNDRLRDAQRTGADMTPILQEAAKSAGVSQATLKSWLDLASNIRAARNAANDSQNLAASATAGIAGPGDFPSPGASQAAWLKQQEAAQKKLLEISARQNGVTKQFTDDLKAYQDALRTGVLSEKEYADAITHANKKRYEGTEAGKEAAKQARAGAVATKAEASAYATLLASYQAKIDLNREEVEFTGRLNEAQKAEIKLDADISAGKVKLSRAHEAELRARIAIWKEQEKAKDQAKREVIYYQEQSAAAQQLADDYVKQSKAKEAVRIASDRADTELSDQLARMELEVSLIGQTTTARELAVAQLDAEIERRKALKALDENLDLDDPAREEERIRINTRYAKRVALAQQKVFVSEWDKTSQLVGDTLADYIMGGGQDAAQYLKRLFATLVLRPIVQYAVGSLMGPGGGGASGAGGIGGGGNGIGGIFGGGSFTPGAAGLGGLAGSFNAGMAGGWVGFEGGISMMQGGQWAAGGMQALGAAAPYIGALIQIGQGKYGSGVGMAAGAYIGSIVPVIGTAIGALIGGIVGGLFDGGARGPNHSGGVASTATTDRDLAVKQVLGTDAWGNTLTDFTDRGNKDLDKQLDKTVKGMLDLYKSLAKIGGVKARDIDIAAGFSVNPKYGDEGAMGFFQLLDKQTGEVLKKYKNRDLDKDPQKAWAQFVADMGGELVNEIKKGDIPGWMKEELDAIGENVTLEGLNAAIQKIAIIDVAFRGWADSVTGFANLTAKAQTELLKFAGGIEALANNVNAFYASFYSEQERAEILQRQVRDQLKKLGIDIDPAGGEAAKKAFRKLIEDALASGNNELAAKLLALAQLFGVAADAAQKSAEVAADAAKKAADEAQAAAEEMARVLAEERQKAKDAAMANFEAAVNREKEYWQGVLSSSQEAVQAISSILNPLKQSAKELIGSIDAAQQMQAAQGMVYIEQALAGVRGGAKLSSFDGLTDAITAARGGIASGRYASQFERDRDALVLANQLSQIAGYGDTQLSVEERQLKNSQEQLQRLDKTLTYWRDLLDDSKAQIDATLSVEDAIRALHALIPGSKPGAGAGQKPDDSGATWGPGGGSQPVDAKYHQVRGGGSSGAWYDPIIDPALIARLDGLAPLYHSFDGTGNLKGLLEAIKGAGGTLSDLSALSGFFYSDWVKAADSVGIPAFDVGTNFVPRDMLAQIHEGEAIVPKAFNPWAGGALGASANERLEALVSQLVADNRAQAGQIVRLQGQIAKLLQRWDGDGLPGQRKEEVTT